MRNVKRSKIAQEAARLLYYDLVADYKTAKEIASRNLEVKAFPSNFEVAVELDRLAESIEGDSRSKLLLCLRETALQIMDSLSSFNPRLIGSVWRGTCRKGSDIDIEVYTEQPQMVSNIIQNAYGDNKIEYTSKTSEGFTEKFLHISFTANLKYNTEIIVKTYEELHKRRKCEIYGDFIVGLTRNQLRELLKKNALKKFLPGDRN